MATSAIAPTAIATLAGSTVPWTGDDVIWLLAVGFVAAFILAFSVGANDVANSFGTSVGSKVLTLRQACILASIFETAGAVLLGAKVGEMIRKGIIDVEIYETEEGTKLLMMGEVSAMFGSGLWQLIATFLKVPVSGTHSTVGACIGFSLVAVGSSGVNWENLGFVVASWFISPVLSGIMAVALYYFIERFILKHENPLKNGLKMLPVFYGVAVGINLFSVLYTGAPLLGFDKIPLWGTLLIALAVMVVVVIITQCHMVPKVRKRQEKLEEMKFDPALLNDVATTSQAGCKENYEKTEFLPSSSRSEAAIKINSYDDYVETSLSTKEERKKRVQFSAMDEDNISCELEVNECRRGFAVQLTSADSISSIDQCEILEKVDKKRGKSKEEESKENEISTTANDDGEDPPAVRHIFSSIQILTACFSSFAHGGNDVSNAIGPLIALWIVFWSGSVEQKSFTPWYLLIYGGVGITIGLWIFGKRVMETIGKDLTKVTPSSGFSVELMTAVTVLFASNLGIPISTTHCKVGAVVSIGWYRSRAAVEWSIVRNIAFAWFITVPAAGLFSAGAMYIFMQFL